MMYELILKSSMYKIYGYKNRRINNIIDFSHDPTMIYSNYSTGVILGGIKLKYINKKYV